MANIRLEIDRFFDWSRTTISKYSFQNEDERHIELLRESGKEYIYTTLPKRAFVSSKGEIDEKGFKVYFKVLNQEKYDLIKVEVFKRFSKKLFISLKPKIQTDYISGFIHFKEIKKKEGI